ncbi:hypothetical protein E3E26_07020 [Thermococcus sp. LS1]|uniref:hypothetical protein n=1 Tax=Thermococcus sp. LS1 TaxID=1638259 RepID=UPI001439E097|nr:hypothetical protein [Thermococcus sp. LS1]NJD99534.1 hypothetical protein [Thermococcus sp. LS1]
MIFRTESIPTVIQVIKSEEGTSIEFKCTVSYKETNADIQEEHFGVHVDNLGRIVYGLELLEAEGVRDKYSLDDIAAVVADVVHDSSQMLNTVVSKYQKRLLELIYFNEPLHRDKFFLVFAEGIEPDLDEEGLRKFLPGMLELRQIVSSIIDIKTLNDGTLLIIGTQGLIIIGRNSYRYERVLLAYAFVRSIENSLDNALARLWRSWDMSEELKNNILSSKGMVSLREVNKKISELQSDVSIVGSVFTYLQETLSSLEEPLSTIDDEELQSILRIQERLGVLRRRVEDAIPVADTLAREVDSLVNVANTLLDNSIARVMNAVEENTKRYVAIGEALELLEVGIFGVYVVELLHIALQYSGIEEELLGITILGLSLAFWAILTIGIGGIALAWYLLKRTKRKILEEGQSSTPCGPSRRSEE